MKKLNSLFVMLLFMATTAFAQFPQAINFQAIARDGNGDVMVATPIQIRLTVLDGSATGTEVYQELRALTTNDYGSFSFQIGRNANYVTIGSFGAIDWNTGAKYLKIDYDPTNQFNWSLSLGTIEFAAVPYAFSAENVTFIDATGAQDGDVLVYNATSGKFEPGSVNATEIDPIFNVSAAKNITTTNISNWNTAYGWGNHAGLYRPISYVPAWTELTSNPFSFASPANNQLLKYNSGTNKWENWTPNFIQTLSLSGTTLSLSNGGGSVTLPSSSYFQYSDELLGTGIVIPSIISNYQMLGIISSEPILQLKNTLNNQNWLIWGEANSSFNIVDYSDPDLRHNVLTISNYVNGGYVGIGTLEPTSKLQVVGLPEYANNAAAVSAGLTVGAFYHTAGVVKVVY